ncbi:hypothetical protein TRAPUB_14394 [Trametes pubescens]|uniref:Uncharacterized protein n=1 Tax=Trametes pubescens TaxID=154538 RepID=A0A1M2VNK1_TRAPU|nr:hypothetical protein TRAPUB_14394 [Trametes pubescens]
MSSPTTPPVGPTGQFQSASLPPDVFKGADVDDLRRHIWILSTALKRCQLAQPTPSQLPGNASKDVRDKFNTLRHISTLLTVGASYDRYAASVNAVAGAVEPDRIVSLIATKNTRTLPPKAPQQNQRSNLQPTESVITELTLGDAHQAMSLLTDFKTDIENIEFNKHLEDVATIVSFLQTAQSTTTRADNLALFSIFMVRRAFRKLSARLHNMTTIWGASDPIAVMLEEFKVAPVIKDHIITFEPPLDDTHTTVLALRKRLEVQGVSSSGSCVVTSDNVCAWLRALSTILTNLKNSLPPATTTPPSFKKASEICTELVLLDTFLQSSFFDALRQSGVEEELLRVYRIGQDLQRQEWGKAQELLTDHEARVADADALGDGEDGTSKIEPGEDTLQHVKRYLQTITAWFVACRALSTPRKAQGVPLHFYHLKAAPGDAIPPEVTQQFKATYLEFVKSTQAEDDHYRNVCTLLDSAFPPGSSRRRPMPVIHAEAAIMALAYNSLAGSNGSGNIPEMQDASNIFLTARPADKDQTGDIPIGISKKCCACCDLFAKYLHESSPSLTFRLPGTHGIIYPWMLPPYPVPPVVLKGMCNELFAAFLRVTSAMDPGLLSTQSSPASTASDLEQPDVLSGLTR